MNTGYHDFTVTQSLLQNPCARRTELNIDTVPTNTNWITRYRLCSKSIGSYWLIHKAKSGSNCRFTRVSSFSKLVFIKTSALLYYHVLSVNGTLSLFHKGSIKFKKKTYSWGFIFSWKLCFVLYRLLEQYIGLFS